MAKKRMRIFSLLIALIVCISALAGCTSEEQITELEAALASALDKISALESAGAEAAEKIAGLEAANDAAAEKIEGLEEANQSAQQEIDVLKDARDDALERLESLKEQNEALKDYVIQNEIYISVGDKWVTPDNAADVLGDGGSVKYDHTNRILILDNVNVTLKDNFIFATDDLTIVLVGNNKVKVECGENNFLYGIYCTDGYAAKDVSLVGGGTLELSLVTDEKTAYAYGINAEYVKVYQSRLNVTVGDTITASTAIHSDNVLFSRSKIELTSGKAVESVALYAEQNVHAEYSTLSATSGDAVRTSEGIYAIGIIDLLDSEVSASAGIAYSGAFDVRCLSAILLYGTSKITADTVHATDGTSTFERKIRIYIDQGHNPSGNPNAGANNGEIFEENITYTVGLMLAEMLRADGRFEVCLSRPTPDTVLGTDNTTSLEARVLDARRFDADYFISIHANSYTDSSVTGTEIYTFSKEGKAADLAASLLEGLVASTGLRNRGVKQSEDFYVLKNSTMPAVLVELGFISNPNDAALMNEQPYLFVSGMYNGILDYFELSK